MKTTNDKETQNILFKTDNVFLQERKSLSKRQSRRKPGIYSPNPNLNSDVGPVMHVQHIRHPS